RPAAAPVSASAPAACPEDDLDPPVFVRPSAWTLLRETTDELRDRLPHLARDASPALRAGLEGLNGDDPLGAVNELRAAPDRVRDGFDVAAAAMLLLGMQALGAERAHEARSWAQRARREAPRDALADLLEAMAVDRPDAARERARLYRRALSLRPDEPALALAAARALAEAGELEEAARHAASYLAEHPEDARIASWARRVRARAELTREHARRTDRGITVLWPDRVLGVRRIDDLTTTIDEAMREVAGLLGEPARAELLVVVYHDVEDMRRATCAPSWSGAVFDGALHVDARTLEGPRASRVTRHEAAHAALAMLAAPIPTWLGEGLAQAMEGPPTAANEAAWQRMVERGYWIPFASLEGELFSIDDADAARLAYHQSLAMYLFLEARGGPTGPRRALSLVRARQREDVLSTVVPGADGAALLAFLRERRAR
ncbi:MAG: hypothetical protein KF729_25085, partial [Sandaracinaceae bacterium]|nr:hypothetical protein [Sandaracinaceae bacterium]